MGTLRKIEIMAERAFFSFRWFCAPIYGGLGLALALLMLRSLHDVWVLSLNALWGTREVFIVGVLELIDLSLIGNLLISVMFAGYENFVSKMNVREHSDYPAWILHTTFSQIKVNITATMAVMSGINLLKTSVEGGGMHELWPGLAVFSAFTIASIAFKAVEIIGHGDDHNQHGATTESH